MAAAPEIVAVNAAREVTDRARAIEDLSDEPGRDRVVFFVLMFAVSLSSNFIAQQLDLTSWWKGGVAGAIVLLCMTPIGMYFEIRQLKRRVNAITYLLLQQER